jgi:uncharacterized protein YndB with AHSA1/START domain
MTNELKVVAPEGTPFIDWEREFDAPVAAVFEAHRDPALVKQWMGPDGTDLNIEEWDFTTNGHWSHWGESEGVKYTFRGVFHTVRENEFAIQTFEFDGVPDVVAIESITFTDLGNGRSKLTGHSVYPSVESRDGMVGSDMELGMSQGYDRLEKLAAAAA